MKKSGPSFRYRGQTYRPAGFQDHVTRSGRRMKLQVLATHCPDFGAAFRVLAAPVAIRNRVLRRRCDACKRRGVPVDGRRRRKARPKRPEDAANGNPRPARLRPPKDASAAVAPPSALVAAVQTAAAKRESYADAIKMLD